MSKIPCFKAYDLRGRVPEELNPVLAEKIGRALALHATPKRVCVGWDIRLSGPELVDALVKGLTESGVEVLKLGLCGTEEVYFGTPHLDCGAGVMVTASHNPADWNGMKFVGAGAVPLTGEDVLGEMEAAILADNLPAPVAKPAAVQDVDIRLAYLEKLLTFIDPKVLKPLCIVVNPGNGCAGPVLRDLESQLPFRFHFLQEEPDGTFPHGVPNPLLPEHRETTARAVQETGADFGLAWDGDFDRCFFYDENGRFLEGYYLVGLLAEVMLARSPGEKIIHDPRLTWNTQDVVTAAGGVPVMSRTGHAFIKARMRQENALYGGEMSAHHYFRDFHYCDTGMVPWLLVAEHLSRLGKPLSRLVDERIMRFPVSGEINRKVSDVASTIQKVREQYQPQAKTSDDTDGLSLDFGRWRFNLRGSNTEPLLRLNVEARGDQVLLEEKTAEILSLIEEVG